MINLLPRSLRWRLQIWLALLLVLVLAAFGLTVYELERVSRVNRIDSELTLRMAVLNNAIRNAPFSKGSPPRPPDETPAAAPMASPAVHRTLAKGLVPGEALVHRPPPGPPPPGPRPKGPPPGPRPDGPRAQGPPPGPPPGSPRPAFPQGTQPEEIAPGGSPTAGSPTRESLDRVRRPAPPPKPNDLALPSDGEGQFSAPYYYVVWYRDGTVLKRSGSAPSDVPAPTFLERDTLTHWRTRQVWRETFHCSGLGDCALAGRSAAPDLRAMRTFALGLIGAGGSALAVALGIGWWLAGRAIRPVQNIIHAANRISGGNLSERVPVVDSGNELGRLAAVLNSTFARLESAFARQRQFAADAAHELRTPLTVLMMETQTALSRERSAAEYRETVEACLEAAQQMRGLTESLLALARADAGNDAVPRSEVNLAEAVLSAVECIRPLAIPRAIQFYCNLEPAIVWCNPAHLSPVITNLLKNAIDYNRSGGEIRISTSSGPDTAILTIANTGIGIAAEDLPHVFDRFYRVDKSRSRAGGHVGLGLAICKVLVEAEHGMIEVDSWLNAGTTFSVWLPRSRERFAGES